jgi:hypothetical protein
MKKQIAKRIMLPLMAQVVAPIFFANVSAQETSKETNKC